MLIDWYRAAWIVLAGVWLLAAFSAKRTVRREPFPSRLVHGCILAIGFLMLFQPWRFGSLDMRFLPDAFPIAVCGLAITFSGVALAIWARLTLGSNWSGTVTVKEDHRLIRKGPYNIVRHPIYSGILLAMLGTAIGFGMLPCLIGLPVAFLALWTKSRTEERFMIEQFGAEYLQYQHDVKAVIPGIL